MADAVAFEVMKYADHKSKYCVFGYIRELEDLLPDSNTVELIPQLCLAFYFAKDEWDTECKSDKAVIDGNLLKLTESLDNYHTAYMKNICVYPGKYIWKFKIKEWNGSNTSWNFIFAIWKERKEKEYLMHSPCAYERECGIGYISIAAKMTDPNRPGWYGKDYGAKCKLLLSG